MRLRPAHEVNPFAMMWVMFGAIAAVAILGDSESALSRGSLSVVALGLSWGLVELLSWLITRGGPEGVLRAKTYAVGATALLSAYALSIALLYLWSTGPTISLDWSAAGKMSNL